MINLEASVIVNTPVERVWNFMSDLNTMPQWNPGVLEVKWQRPIGVGSIIVVTNQLFGRMTVNVKITDWEPNRKIGMESRSRGVKGYSVTTMEPP
jgi:uncharacterized membrane protein